MVARLEQKEFLNGAKHLKKLSSDARTGQDSSGEEDSDDDGARPAGANKDNNNQMDEREESNNQMDEDQLGFVDKPEGEEDDG